MRGCAGAEGRRITGSARQTLDVLCVVRKQNGRRSRRRVGGKLRAAEGPADLFLGLFCVLNKEIPC